jgi:putative spermidine/putrescine transport system permease protein
VRSAQEIDATQKPADHRPLRWRGVINALWLLPGAVLMTCFFIAPILMIFRDSVLDPGFTLDNYRMLASDPLYYRVFWNSVRAAIEATLGCLALGYALAYIAFRASPRWRQIIISSLLFAFAVGTVPRTFSWLVILGDRGLVNRVIGAVTGATAPIQLIFNQFSVVLGMLHVMLPYMVLILLGSMMRVGPRLVPAARTLGASPRQAFLRVFLPLTAPGIIAGSMLIFVYSLGFYLVPAVLGGASQTTVVMQIESLAMKSGIWGTAASLSTVVILVSIAGAAFYLKLTGLSDVSRRD